MEKIKVIFLDIDGVLQPYNSKKRFYYQEKYGLDNLQKKLTDELGKDYFQYDEYDVGACYYDWDINAVNRIKRILNETGAKIVISSDWRSIRFPNKMKDFLKIWDLEKYLIGETLYFSKIFDINPDKYKQEEEFIKKQNNNKHYDERCIEIIYYVHSHNNIINYVAIDDRNLSDLPEGHFVKTYNLITEEQTDKVIELLNK